MEGFKSLKFKEEIEYPSARREKDKVEPFVRDVTSQSARKSTKEGTVRQLYTHREPERCKDKGGEG